MASMALSVPASTKMSTRASVSPKPAGFAPRAIALPGSSKTTSSRLSLAVKALPQEGESYQDLKFDLQSSQGEDLLGSSHFELTPWDFKKEYNMIKIWFNMPGVAAQDLRVYVKDHMLFVQGKHLRLPPNIKKEEIKAKLWNGVLYVSVPKTTPDFEAYPIRVEAVKY